MAAREDQLQPLVGKGHVFHLILGDLPELQLAKLAIQRAPAADQVDRAVSCGRDQPGPGVRRGSVTRPALRRDGEGLLSGLLGEVEVAEEADEGREHTTPLLTEGPLEDR